MMRMWEASAVTALIYLLSYFASSYFVMWTSLNLSTGLRTFIDSAKGEKKENLPLNSCDNIKYLTQLWPLDLLEHWLFDAKSGKYIYTYQEICVFPMLILRKGKKKTKYSVPGQQRERK